MSGILEHFISWAFRRDRPRPSVAPGPRRPIRARYDLAQTNDDNRRHWAAIDSYDADAANSVSVRRTMVKRSRYETENNGYAKGVNRTLANYTVGRGPKLRLQTRSSAFNAMVQDAWRRWGKRVRLARKLRTAVKARARDGETFLLATINANLRDRVKLDLVGIECEQCTSTDLLFAQKGRIDGVHFDDYGNPTAYDILSFHPGGQFFWPNNQAKKIDAKFVFHLFQEERPGQHRAIPEAASTMPICAQSRRWRESTLQTAENLANFSIFLKSNDAANDEPDYSIAALSTLEIERGMMTKLPVGEEPFQPKPEQPPATYEAFLRTQIGEQVRPFSMSYSLGACDSSNANFASAKLDQHPFHFQVDVDQADIEDLVLDPLFELWFEEAARVYGWSWTLDDVPAHTWDWPAMPIINEVDTASSRETNCRTGIGSVPRYLAEDGFDAEEELQKEADYYGVTIEAMRAAHFANLTSRNQQPAAAARDGGAEDEPTSPNGNAYKNNNARNRMAALFAESHA